MAAGVGTLASQRARASQQGSERSWQGCGNVRGPTPNKSQHVIVILGEDAGAPVGWLAEVLKPAKMRWLPADITLPEVPVGCREAAWRSGNSPSPGVSREPCARLQLLLYGCALGLYGSKVGLIQPVVETLHLGVGALTEGLGAGGQACQAGGVSVMAVRV
ncbi:hypothetical protein HaLaN_30108 [Haematococcus lacustris]|uniref:Uncharacterized protein n=1 Tax=Haematococcus lacustris TaxID=44745 RepID=A0A6A0AE03_HAELA|nr:hypothetical protein HaLaN_30108 [Haematococcus lacustris]